jgi:hypothetical protein
MCLIHSRFLKRISLQRAGYFSSSIESQKQHLVHPCQLRLAKLSIVKNTLLFKNHLITYKAITTTRWERWLQLMQKLIDDQLNASSDLFSWNFVFSGIYTS